MTMSGNDMIMLFPDVVQCMSIKDLEIKKMCFLYLVNYAKAKPEIAMSGLPILLAVSLEELSGNDADDYRTLKTRILWYAP
jgi:vesicle coat complex subunit